MSGGTSRTDRGSDRSNATYVMRGLVVYYGKHYWAYFFSQKFDTWFQFNDAQISRIGNFSDVISKTVQAKAIPRTVFFERQDLIINMLLEGDVICADTDLSKIYCSDSQMQVNNFWKNRPSSKPTGDRCTVF